MALDDFELLEHRARERVGLKLAVHAADIGDEPSVDGHAIQRRAHPAHGQAGDVALVVEVAGHTGEAYREFAGTHVGQISERIHRHDVLHVVRIPLRGDRRRAALTLTGDLKFLQLVDSGREVEITHGALAGTDHHRRPRGVEPEIGGNDLMRPRRHAGEHVATGIVRQGNETERGDFHLGAFKQIARAGVVN